MVIPGFHHLSNSGVILCHKAKVILSEVLLLFAQRHVTKRHGPLALFPNFFAATCRPVFNMIKPQNLSSTLAEYEGLRPKETARYSCNVDVGTNIRNTQTIDIHHDRDRTKSFHCHSPSSNSNEHRQKQHNKNNFLKTYSGFLNLNDI